MTNVTEKDIVEFLNKKIIFHNHEIHRLREILTAININYVEDNTGNHQYIESFSDEAFQSEVFKSRFRQLSAKPLMVPDKYRAQLPLSLKIAYVLDKIKTGVKDEIAFQLQCLQPELDIDQLTKHLATVLSELKSKNLLSTTKEGRKFRYSLYQQATGKF